MLKNPLSCALHVEHQLICTLCLQITIPPLNASTNLAYTVENLGLIQLELGYFSCSLVRIILQPCMILLLTFATIIYTVTRCLTFCPQSTNYAHEYCSLSSNNTMNIWLAINVIMRILRTDGTNLQ